MYLSHHVVCDIRTSKQEQMPIEESGNMVNSHQLILFVLFCTYSRVHNTSQLTHMHAYVCSWVAAAHDSWKRVQESQSERHLVETVLVCL